MNHQKHPPSPLAFYIIFILGGLILGAAMKDTVGSLFGGLLGYTLAAIVSIQRRLARLEEALTIPAPPQVDAAKHVRNEVMEERLGEDAFLKPAPSRSAASPKTVVSYHNAIDDASSLHTKSMAPQDSSQATHKGTTNGSGNIFVGVGLLGESVKNFFTTGNVILKIGLIVLFCGVSFLLKYAAQRNLVPIELRLITVALGGLTLLGIGWRLKHRQLFYGLLLQGGGIGILYLTIFAAAKLYQLLPFALAFPLMLCIVGLSGALAILQNEKWLAIFGSIGGFLAPVLLSTGEGSHVALFSYYLLLNIGILGIAWFKAWRELNLLGCVFTFAIGSFWGSSYYQPAYFSSVEPFLLATFLLYAAISILFALKQPVDLKGYIDPPLVFGVPIATFALQYCLVKNFEHGLALSSVGFGLYYMFCATALWHRYSTMRMLVEIFLSFGVVFGSLAIPLALDGYWITAAWAMEGAALIWVGVRQTRIRARIFGVLLQLGAGISFMNSLSLTGAGLPVLNGLYLSCLLLAAAALFSSYYLTTRTEKILGWESYLVIPLLFWGLCWWFGGGIREIDLFVKPADKMNIFLVFISVSCLAIGYTARKLLWQHLLFPPLILLPVLVLLSLRHFGVTAPAHLFAGWGVFCWVIGLCGQYILLHAFEKDWPKILVESSHTVTLWLIVFLFTRESVWFVEQMLDESVWIFITWGVVPAAGVALLNGPGKKLPWPIGRFFDSYLHIGIAFVVIYLCGWSLFAVLNPGDPTPLPFLPLLNPLEIFQMVVLLVCWNWAWQCRPWLGRMFEHQRLPLVLYWPPAVIIFLWLNAAVARSVHFFGQVTYEYAALFHSTLFQAAISILWSLTALALMSWSARKHSRQVWMVGAGLLSLVVLKLFVIDLSGTGTIGRIVSFLVVGLLMLLIGYISPLPPRHEVSA